MSSIYSYNFKKELEEEILKELKTFMEYIDMKNGKLHPANLPGEDYDLFDEPDYTALDTQIGGDHYKKLKIQPIEYILANELGFCEGNIIKYISRWREKGGVEDLKKIKQYCDFLIEQDNL